MEISYFAQPCNSCQKFNLFLFRLPFVCSVLDSCNASPPFTSTFLQTSFPEASPPLLWTPPFTSSGISIPRVLHQFIRFLLHQHLQLSPLCHHRIGLWLPHQTPAKSISTPSTSSTITSHHNHRCTDSTGKYSYFPNNLRSLFHKMKPQWKYCTYYCNKLH